ncbi:MAG: DUF5989 family protein [Candidatus Muiribacteriota bacterium]
MKKLFYILYQMLSLIKKHKVYFLAPILIMFALLALLVFILGPNALMALIYAGV